MHDYLGMNMDFSKEGKVIIIMNNHVADILEDTRSDMSGEDARLATEQLFMVSDNTNLLIKGYRQYLHTMIAKIPFLYNRARLDLQEAAASMKKRFKAQEKDDYKELGRAMKYLREKPKPALTQEADNTHVVKW